MEDYERTEEKTIDTRVADTFKIEVYDLSYFVGKLHLPDNNAFVLRGSRKKPMSKNMGAARITTLTIEALLEGTYEIEYQYYNPTDKENKTKKGLVKIDSASVYKINVLPE